MSILGGLFKPRVPTVEPVAAEPTSQDKKPGLLVVGDDFAWLAGHQEINGRPLYVVLMPDDADRTLSTSQMDGVVVGYRDFQRSLEVVKDLAAVYPSVTYVLRADPAETKGLTLTHPVLPRTHSVDVMGDTLLTTFALLEWRKDEAFAKLFSQIRVLPTLPALYTQITAALQQEDSSLETIADLISREPAVTAKLLQFVNSPLFSLKQRVTSVSEAAGFFGMSRLRSLVLATSLFAQFDESKCPSFSLEKFTAQSIQIAAWAATISAVEADSKQLGEMAFTAGLLHNFGVFLLAANLPDGYDQVLRTAKEQRVSIARAERLTYGVTHAELAGFILASWGLPFPIVNAVGFYSNPSLSKDTVFTPLTAVHAATAIATYASTGTMEFDRPYLDRMNFVSNFESWCGRLSGQDWKG